MVDREQIRARAEAARGLQSTRPQQEDFNHNALFDILALLAAIDELEATVTVAESEIAELEAARDRVLALHKKQYAGPFQSTPAGPRYWCEECNVTWPCETVRTVTP